MRAPVGLDDDVLELRDVAQTAERGDRELEFLRRGRGRLADLPGGDLDVLLARSPSTTSCVVSLRALRLGGSSQTRML